MEVSLKFQHVHPRHRLATLAASLLGLGLVSAAPRAGVKPADHRLASPSAPTASTAAPDSVRRARMVEGDNHLFLISTPAGWVLDDTAGMGSRIRCVFYPDRKSVV